MKSPAFEKFPDRVLVGFAQVVIEEVLTEEAVRPNISNV